MKTCKMCGHSDWPNAKSCSKCGEPYGMVTSDRAWAGKVQTGLNMMLFSLFAGIGVGVFSVLFPKGVLLWSLMALVVFVVGFAGKCLCTAAPATAGRGLIKASLVFDILGIIAATTKTVLTYQAFSAVNYSAVKSKLAIAAWCNYGGMALGLISGILLLLFLRKCARSVGSEKLARRANSIFYIVSAMIVFPLLLAVVAIAGQTPIPLYAAGLTLIGLAITYLVQYTRLLVGLGNQLARA